MYIIYIKEYMMYLNNIKELDYNNIKVLKKQIRKLKTNKK